MKFSLTYPLISHPCDPAFLQRRNVVRLARAAEAAGYDGLAFTDHPAPTQKWLDAGGHDALDPFAALAFCAAVTERIRLMPNILVLPYRNPFIVAKAIATVDVLSEGRFTLAVAPGYLEAEYEALGVEFSDRNALFDEALEVIKGIFSRDDFSHQGPHFRGQGLTANPKPLQRPHPPIWIGGNSRLARRRVARHAQGWTPFPASRGLARVVRTPVLQTTADLRVALEDLWKGLEEAGRDPSQIDVSFGCSAGGSPGREDFDADAHRAGLEELAGLGVTWVGAGVPADSVEHALEAIARYGETVIARDRSRAS